MENLTVRPPRGRELQVVIVMVTRAGLQATAMGLGCGVQEKWFVASGDSSMRVEYMMVQQGDRKRHGKCREVSDNRNRYLR